MASSVSFIIQIFNIISLLLLSSLSSSTSAKILVLPLSHSLSKTQFNSTHHLLKTTTTHSTARLNHHRHQHQHQHQHHSRQQHRQVSLPLTPGSDYTVSFSIGSQTISLYMDTGSDIVWLPCHPFTCIMCEGKYNPSTITSPGPLNVTFASPVTCKSRACLSAHSSRSSSDLCAMAHCPLEDIEVSDCASHACPPFYYAYADGSFIAKLYSDTLSVPSLTLRNFTFGCAHSALAEPIGVAGFGRGALSMPAQLATTAPEMGNHFSYCLISHSFDSTRVRRPSPLILGRNLAEEEEYKGRDFDGGDGSSKLAAMVYTPMLENPRHPYFYCVGLEGISVGKKKIAAPESLKLVDRRGNGGMVVDSGTTFTMLPKKFYDMVVAEFVGRVDPVYTRASQIEDRTGLSPCYYIANDDVGKVVPKVVLHFGGNNKKKKKNYSSVEMPRKNYFYEFIDGGDNGVKRNKVGCLMFINGGDEAESGGGPAGLLGNYQQQGFEVVYDLEEGRVGFARRKCASLWDTLNHH